MNRLKKITAIFIITAIATTSALTGCSRIDVFDPPPVWNESEIDSALMHYEYYQLMPVSERPLFASDGSVNQDVLENLHAILNSEELNPYLRQPKTAWYSGLAFEFEGDSNFTSVNARDFSHYVLGGDYDADPTTNDVTSRSGAIVIRLFESIPDSYGVENQHLSELTDQWWQVVYRSVEDANGEVNDVLTLWMLQPYRITHHSGDQYENITARSNERHYDRRIGDGVWVPMRLNQTNSILTDEDIANGGARASNGFFLEANYSNSIARANLQRDLSGLLENFNGVENYIVAPRNLPGAWQSSEFQTGSNMVGRFFVSGQFYTTPDTNEERQHFIQERFPGSENRIDGLGATGLIWGTHLHFSIGNGKDGLSVGPVDGQWANTEFKPTHDDLLWLPSDFEIRTVGHNQEPATFQTFIAEAGNSESSLRFNWNANSTREQDSRTDLSGGRSGLWQLNGFDRAHNSASVRSEIEVENDWEAMLNWLRTGDGIAIGSANTVCHAGNRYSYGVTQRGGMRPGIHLSLTALFDGLE